MQHEVHDEVSLEMSRPVIPRLREQPALLQIARDNLARRLREGAEAPALPRCYCEWLGILNCPIGEICQILCAYTEEGVCAALGFPLPVLCTPRELMAK